MNSALPVRLSIRLQRRFSRIGSLLYSGFLCEVRVQLKQKSDEALLEKNGYYSQIGVNGAFLGPKSNTFELSTESVHWVFLEL